jgi:RNA polymerase sigma factor (TIGR02999 family)
MPDSSEPITELYKEMRAGDKAAEKRLFDLLYAELCGQARQILQGEPRHDAIVTARGLVNEACARLFARMPEIADRQHLHALLMQIMRRVKIDWARKRRRRKRDAPVSPLDTQNLRQAEAKAFENERGRRVGPVEMIVIKDSLFRLSQSDPHLANLLELHYFSDKTIEEIATELSLPKTIVHRQIQLACAKLAVLVEAQDKTDDLAH